MLKETLALIDAFYIIFIKEYKMEQIMKFNIRFAARQILI